MSPLSHLSRCGRLHDRRGLCPACRREHERARGSSTQRGLGADHRRVRAQVLREETTCWICGRPGSPGDPLTADHIDARADGGTNTRENMRAAHASCNSRRGGWIRARRAESVKTPNPAVSRSVRVPSRGAGQREDACPERRRYRVRRTAPTMSSARHVASRTGPTISTTQRVTVSEDGEPLTQLFHVSLPAVKAITVAMTRARRAPPESVEATRKGQRGLRQPSAGRARMPQGALGIRQR